MTLPPPAEWAPHDAVWIGFPSHAELWLEDLEPAQAEVAGFANAVHTGGRGERVILVAANDEAAEAARKLAPHADVIVEAFGDIWLRDTAAILDGQGVAHDFDFNYWGGKYDLPGDKDVGARLAGRAKLRTERHDWILEGGAIDGDGTGRCVTTEQCLLNPNRNPDLSRQDIEARLQADLGYTSVLWLGDGLANDHTDGHVDNLARFVGENRLLVPQGTQDDPNTAIYEDAAARAQAAGIDVVRFPSPGRVLDEDGEIIPASYMNFYIGNAVVVAPVYGQPNDQAALDALGGLFPGRDIVGVRADHILTGGGSVHCISQQLPRL